MTVVELFADDGRFRLLKQPATAIRPGHARSITNARRIPEKSDVWPIARPRPFRVDYMCPSVWAYRSSQNGNLSRPCQRIHSRTTKHSAISGSPVISPTRAHSRLPIPSRPAATMFGMLPGISMPIEQRLSHKENWLESKWGCGSSAASGRAPAPVRTSIEIENHPFSSLSPRRPSCLSLNSACEYLKFLAPALVYCHETRQQFACLWYIAKRQMNNQ